jgi:MFS family permease
VTDRPEQATRQLALTSVGVVLGLAPWFSTTAVAPAMVAEWGLSGAATAWLTMAVQLGFVGGTLLSAATMLSDRWSARRLAAWSAALAAASTAAIACCTSSAGAAIAWRVLTGVALAGVYPPAMKIVAGWWRERRGLAVGVLIGALSLGSAAPHLLRVIVPQGEWRLVLFAAAGSALLAAGVFGFTVRAGPYEARSSPLDRAAFARIVRDRGVMLATAGYLGHMWELYAMWSWVAAFWAVIAAARGYPSALPALIAFGALAAGAAGCVAGGWIADRSGRTALTIGAMAISGLCALIIGPLAGGSFAILLVITMVWGASVVADSAQFSTCITELVPAEYTGTALTLQTSLGFLLTIVSIRGVPLWVARWGWTYAFMPLAVGPLLGCLAMWRLRGLPEAERLASGRR